MAKRTVAERISERQNRETRKVEIVHTTAVRIRELIDSARTAYAEQDPDADLDDVETQILDLTSGEEVTS